MIEVCRTIAYIMRTSRCETGSLSHLDMPEPLRSISDILFHVIAFPLARDTLFSEPTLMSGEFHDYDTILFLFGDIAIAVAIKRA